MTEYRDRWWALVDTNETSGLKIGEEFVCQVGECQPLNNPRAVYG